MKRNYKYFIMNDLNEPCKENELYFFEYKCTLPTGVDFNQIDNILPFWNTEIVDIKTETKFDEPVLIVHFFIEARTLTDFKSWLQEFEDLNRTSYSVRSSQNGTGRYIHHKMRLNCKHNTQGDKVHESLQMHQTAKISADIKQFSRKTHNTNCPSTITVKIHAIKKYYREKNKKLGELKTRKPCEIILAATHNHDTRSLDALKFRKVSNQVENKLASLFQQGHTPRTALETIKMEIRLTYDNYEQLLMDRKYCPDFAFCKYMFFSKLHLNMPKECENGYGAFQSRLVQRLKQYNDEMRDECCLIEIDEKKNYVICICTPLMKRVHRYVTESSQTVYMDFSGKIKKYGRKVCVLLTHGQCGGMPLAVLITSSEKSEVVSRGFDLLKVMLGEDLFNGSPQGPKEFITDDIQSAQKAVEDSWPRAKRVLCTFGVLQSTNRFLAKTSNGIPRNEQDLFFKQFRSIMFANTVEECSSKFKEALNRAANHESYTQYLQKCWSRKETWALAFRTGALVGQSLEFAMKLIKESIFERVKTFNVLQLVDFFLTNFIQYYERRLLNLANNQQLQNNFITPPSVNVRQHIETLSDYIVSVPCDSIDKSFMVVDLRALLCSCTNNNERICEHIYWAYYTVFSEQCDKIFDPNTRNTFHVVATGTAHCNVDEATDCDMVDDDNAIDGGNIDEVIDCDMVDDDKDIDGGNVDEVIDCDIVDDNNYIDCDDDDNNDSDNSENKQLFASEISEMFSQFIEKYPEEAVSGLDRIHSSLVNVNATEAFVAACRKLKKEDDCAMDQNALTSQINSSTKDEEKVVTAQYGKISQCIKRRYKDNENGNLLEKKIKHEEYSDKSSGIKKDVKEIEVLPKNMLIPDENGVVKINYKQVPFLSDGAYLMSKTAGLVKLNSTAAKLATSGGKTFVKLVPKQGQTKIKIIKEDEGVTEESISSIKMDADLPKIRIPKTGMSTPKERRIVSRKPEPKLSVPNAEHDIDYETESPECIYDLPLAMSERPSDDAYALNPVTGNLELKEEEIEVLDTKYSEEYNELENIVKLAAADIAEGDLETDETQDVPIISSAVTKSVVSPCPETQKTVAFTMNQNLTPTVIMSDNGTQFHAREIVTFIDNKETGMNSLQKTIPTGKMLRSLLKTNTKETIVSKKSKTICRKNNNVALSNLVKKSTKSSGTVPTTATSEPVKSTLTTSESFTQANYENPIVVAGNDGIFYQIVGQNEQGQAILIAQETAAQQDKCLLMTSPAETVADKAIYVSDISLSESRIAFSQSGIALTETALALSGADKSFLRTEVALSNYKPALCKDANIAVSDANVAISKSGVAPAETTLALPKDDLYLLENGGEAIPESEADDVAVSDADVALAKSEIDIPDIALQNAEVVLQETDVALHESHVALYDTDILIPGVALHKCHVALSEMTVPDIALQNADVALYDSCMALSESDLNITDVAIHDTDVALHETHVYDTGMSIVDVAFQNEAVALSEPEMAVPGVAFQDVDVALHEADVAPHECNHFLNLK